MMTGAASRPYDWLSDDHLFGALRHWHVEHLPGDPPSPAGAALAAAATATATADCPRELDDLMTLCWSGDEAQRPTFADINVFFTVKSAGFCPPPAARHGWPQ